MTMDDLITYFRILKPKKSCSFDEISMFMLKLAMPRIVSSLVYIYIYIYIYIIFVSLSATFHLYSKKH